MEPASIDSAPPGSVQPLPLSEAQIAQKLARKKRDATTVVGGILSQHHRHQKPARISPDGVGGIGSHQQIAKPHGEHTLPHGVGLSADCAVRYFGHRRKRRGRFSLQGKAVLAFLGGGASSSSPLLLAAVAVVTVPADASGEPPGMNREPLG